MEEFLDQELRRENDGMTYFAHAGGLADVTFVIDSILKRPAGFCLSASFSGSAAIIVTVERGRYKWTFADSFWLMRDSLAKIGKSLGVKKTADEYACSNYPACGHGKDKCIFWAPYSILRDYNARDCRILWLAIKRMEEELLELGGELKLTVASCALRLFRGRFLTEDIPTNDKINGYAKEAYVASRVEVFDHVFEAPKLGDHYLASLPERLRRQAMETGHTCQDFITKGEGVGHVCPGAHYHDVNSSFPYSLCQALPGKFLGLSTKWNEDDRIALVEATVVAPDIYTPPIPRKLDNRVYFPTGKWRGWFMGTDLQLLLKSGGKVVKVHRCFRFQPFYDFRAYVETIYGLRRGTSDPFRKIMYKYLMNTGYGKLSESSEKDGLVFNKDLPRGATIVKARPEVGCFLFTRDIEVPHAHVPAAAGCTSNSRAVLTETIWEGERLGGGCIYCDTDSNLNRAILKTGPELGQMKLEGIFRNGRMVAPKLYGMQGWKIGDDGELEKQIADYVRAKGFSPRDGTKLTFEGFCNIANGAKFEVPRMLRVKELVSSGNSTPREELFSKKVRQVERPKRALLSDGHSTRPWDVEELEEPWTGAKK
jgi:hypothetical protein